MSIDDSVGRDPRITALAVQVGWSRRETVGCLVMDVWPICYDQMTELVSPKLVDAAAGLPGFAQAMVDCELARRDRSGKVRISGARERIAYLSDKRAAGRLGGLKSAEKRASESKQTSSTAPSTPQAASNPPVPDPVPDSSPVPVSSPEEKDPPPAAPVRVIGKLKGCTPQEQAQANEVLSRLAARSGRKYGASGKHQALVISRLRAGYSVWDLRRVIGYCAIELGWEDKPAMQPFLRPETLFGPESMEKYIYAARAWEPSEHPPPDEPQRAAPKPALTIVKDSAEPVTDPWKEPEWMTAMTTPR